MSSSTAPADESSPDNRALIEQVASVPVLGQTPWMGGALDASSVQDMVEAHLDLTVLVQTLLPAQKPFGSKEAMHA